MNNPYFDEQLDPDEARRRERYLQQRQFKRSARSGTRKLKNMLWTYLGAPLRWAWWWLVSRDLVRLVRGIPALVLATVFLFVLYEARRVSSGDIVERYQEAAMAAISAEEDEAALLWLREAVNTDPENRNLRFALAMEFDRQDEKKQAFDIVSQLAPLDAPGLPRAHAWMAQQLLQTKNSATLETRRMIRYHLQQVLEADEMNESANVVMAQVELADGNIEQAIRCFARLPRSNAAGALTLAQLYQSTKRFADARKAAEAARSVFEAETRENPDNIKARIGWARAETFLQNFESATSVLITGLQRLGVEVLEKSRIPKIVRGALAIPDSSDSPGDDPTARLDSADPTEQQVARMTVLRRELGVTYLVWRAALMQKSERDQEREMELLLVAVDIAPDTPVVIAELARMATAEKPDPAIEEMMSQLLASGRATPIAHFILGTGALQKSDLEKAERHLRLAIQANPRLAAAANNLAYVMRTSDPPRLAEAESLIDLAALTSPEHPEIRETRGQVRAQLGKTDAAISDLEYALGRLGSRPAIHRTLASLYERLGDKELARQHRKLAGEDSEIPQEPAVSRN